MREPSPGLELTYGPESCSVHVRIEGGKTLVYALRASARSGRPVLAHLTLLPRPGQTLETRDGSKHRLTDERLELSPESVRGGLAFAGCRLTLPPTASLHWPALPHNPYRKDGRAEPAEGRIEIRIPFDGEHEQHLVTIHVPG